MYYICIYVIFFTHSLTYFNSLEYFGALIPDIIS